jgi:hypothetical protein
VVGQPPFQGRGVYYFQGSVRCPLAGLGQRGPYDSNRLALDDDRTRVIVDRAARRIVIENQYNYPKRQVIGDLVFLATATTRAGVRVPAAVHLKIEKKGQSYDADVHSHPSVKDALVAADFEAYTVIARGGAKSTVLLTPDIALRAVQKPRIGARLASRLFQVTDNLAGVKQDATRPGYRLVDLTFAVGLGRLSQRQLQAQIVSLSSDNAVATGGDLAAMLRHGDWELRLTALSRQNKDVFSRDLFLIGLDGVGLSILHRLAESGIEAGEVLSVRLRDGGGMLSLGDQSQSLTAAPDVARAFLEFHTLGTVLAQALMSRQAAARRAP